MALLLLLAVVQMAGRAGRRGLDAVGVVVIAAWEEPPGVCAAGLTGGDCVCVCMCTQPQPAVRVLSEALGQFLV